MSAYVPKPCKPHSCPICGAKVQRSNKLYCSPNCGVKATFLRSGRYCLKIVKKTTNTDILKQDLISEPQK